MNATEQAAVSSPLSHAGNVDPEVTLRLLEAVHENRDLTQRGLSRQLGIALGLANAYLRQCANKGLIKISQAPPNRYAYYLTPKGLSEKSRLAAEYFSQSFKLFRAARAQFDSDAALCAANGWNRVALWGIGSLGEVALLSFYDRVCVVGFIDEHTEHQTYLGYPVVRGPDQLAAVDVIIVTGTENAHDIYAKACRAMSSDRILVPKFLHVDPHPLRDAT